MWPGCVACPWRSGLAACQPELLPSCYVLSRCDCDGGEVAVGVADAVHPLDDDGASASSAAPILERVRPDSGVCPSRQDNGGADVVADSVVVGVVGSIFALVTGVVAVPALSRGSASLAVTARTFHVLRLLAFLATIALFVSRVGHSHSPFVCQEPPDRSPEPCVDPRNPIELFGPCRSRQTLIAELWAYWCLCCDSDCRVL